MKTPIPEYQVKLDPMSFGFIKWQHRLSPELGGGIYDRSYISIFDLENDLADKFGARFASKVCKDLAKHGRSTNR